MPSREAMPAPAVATRLVHAGKRLPADAVHPVNPPVVRASTVIYDNLAQYRDMRQRRDGERLFTYGAKGTPTSFALEDVVTELEGGYRTRLFPTGLSAAAMVLLSYLKPGDHVVITDCVYEPVRHFAAQFLQPYGIECSFCPADGSGIESSLRESTRLIYLETPGSLVYEVCDLPRIAALAKSRGILVAADNTWGSGVLYRPLTLGADISVIAATKYLGGHSDVMLGTATTTRAAWTPLHKRCDAFGVSVSPDDAWLVLRGMRSLKARMAMHETSALRVAAWLQQRQEVKTVFCPALPNDPGHALWCRDFTGTNGLLSFELHPRHAQQDADRLVESLRLFAIGSSWGGYESLVMPQNVAKARTVADWSARGPIIRIHVGLEDAGDLLRDLGCGFAALTLSGDTQCQ